MKQRLVIAALVSAVGFSLTLAAAQSPETVGPTLRGVRSPLRVDPPMAQGSSAGERQVSSVAVDRRANVYILQRGVPKPIVVTDRQGHVLRSWGEGLFKLPHGIRVDPLGNVWTLDANTSMVYKFNHEGKQLLAIALENYPPHEPRPPNPFAPAFVGPTDIAFGRHGHFYIADGYANSRVLEFDAFGKKIREWGAAGEGPGQFRVVHGIAVGPDGNLYVADRENRRVQRFTEEGVYLGEWRYPWRVFSLDFGHHGDVYIGISTDPRVLPAGVTAAIEGRVLEADAKTGKVVGEVGAPYHSVAIRRDGSIVSGTTTGGVVLFHPTRY